MSEFSERCKEYIHLSGTNVYQIAQLSNLDRTSLQRMVTGKRLPGIKFVKEFCNYLKINQLEKEELLELYQIETLGKETYYNRRCIHKLLEYVNMAVTFSGDKKEELVSKLLVGNTMLIPVETEKAIDKFLRQCFFDQASTELYTNFPPNQAAIYQIMLRIAEQFDGLPIIRHLFAIQKNPVLFSEESMNLNIFFNTLSFALCGYDSYYPYFYYSNSSSRDDIYDLYPYYLICESSVLLITSDFSGSILLEEKEIVRSYLEEFRRKQQIAVPFFQQTVDAGQVLNSYCTVAEKKGTLGAYILEPHPCIVMLFPEKEVLINTYEESAFSSDIVKALHRIFQMEDVIGEKKEEVTCYFPIGGLRNFVENGMLEGPYSYHQRPINVKQRKEIIQQLLDTHMFHGGCRMLKENFFSSVSIHMELFQDHSLFFCSLLEEEKFFSVKIQEHSIGQAFYDYFESLEKSENCVYSTEESEKILKEMLKRCSR